MVQISTAIFISMLLGLFSNVATAMTRSITVPGTDTTIYTKVDVPAQFPGGEAKWNEYVKLRI